MPEQDIQSLHNKIRFFTVATVIIFLLIIGNFTFAVFYPHQKTATIIGPIGPSGQSGQQGPTGLQGDTGDTGRTGAQGPQGVSGPAGTNGLNGTNGIDGAPGSQGLQGLQGIQGIPGLNGTNGTNGIDGKQVELRGNNTTKAIEWRYIGDANWQILVKYCDLTNTCVPVISSTD